MSAEAVVVRRRAPGAVDVPPPSSAPRDFHSTMPGYAPTPLKPAPHAAERIGVAEVLVKDESSRLGLPSFKVLGASWAIARALEVSSFDELSRAAKALAPFTLSAATDGNHGHGVARVAALLGFDARIYVPRGTAQARIDAIAAEGAAVTVVDGGYEDAVRRSARDAGDRCLVISDTSWPGYDEIPRWVVDGYETVFAEMDATADVVVVPIGVGALAAATVRHFWAANGPRPLIVGVEPTSAACVLRSVLAGEIVTLTEPQDSIMAGLNCATPSLVAWPLVSRGIDAYLAIDDGRVPEAMRLLARDGIVAGETGAAGLAGLLRLVDAPADGLALAPDARVLLISTEGATDPAAYERLTGPAP